MKRRPARDAKARFSELLDTCLKEGPQVVTRRGIDAAVRTPMKDWHQLQQPARPTLKALLLADYACGDLSVPDRGRMVRRRER